MAAGTAVTPRGVEPGSDGVLALAGTPTPPVFESSGNNSGRNLLRFCSIVSKQYDGSRERCFGFALPGFMPQQTGTGKMRLEPTTVPRGLCPGMPRHYGMTTTTSSIARLLCRDRCHGTFVGLLSMLSGVIRLPGPLPRDLVGLLSMLPRVIRRPLPRDLVGLLSMLSLRRPLPRDQ